MNLRQATLEDLKDLQELNKKVMVNNPSYDDDLVPDYFDTPAGTKYLQDAITAKDGCFFIAEENNQMIGYFNCSPMEIPYAKSKYLEIENIGVIPEYKHKGYGKQMMEAIIEWAREHKYDRLFLNCYARNEEAIDFYKKCGFEHIDVNMQRKL